MSPKKRAQKIKSKLEDIMKQTFCDCKSSNSEVAAKASCINTLAYECCKDIDKLISNSKKDSGSYKPVEKGSLY